MSLFTRRGWTITAQQMIPPRMAHHTGSVYVDNESAMRHSAVWACLRLRADLVSTMPIDIYRRVVGVQVEVPKPPVFITPGGDQCRMIEWLYSSQVDLDRAGNAFGIITARDGSKNPARIELAPLSEVTVRTKGHQISEYYIAGETYRPDQIWHERQYTVAGIPIGLSAVAYAAWSIGGYLSAQEFVLDWFNDGTIPAAMLRNTQKTVAGAAAAEIKSRFKAAVQNRDLFVTGADWEYQMIQAQNAQPQFIDAMQYGVTDIGRFFGVPADLIDAAVNSGTKITYSNITQRNLQFLIMHLQPALTRREEALSTWLPQPRYVKFNTDALLRMDPVSRAAALAEQINSRTLTPDEARELDNRPPLTPEQIQQFHDLFGTADITASASSPAIKEPKP